MRGPSGAEEQSWTGHGRAAEWDGESAKNETAIFFKRVKIPRRAVRNNLLPVRGTEIKKAALLPLFFLFIGCCVYGSKLGAPQGIGQGGALFGRVFSLFPEHSDLIFFFFTSHANVTQHNRAAGKGNVRFSGKKCSTYKSGWKGWRRGRHPVQVSVTFLPIRQTTGPDASCPKNPLGSAVPVSSNSVLLKINCFLSILKQSTHQAVLRCHWQRREMEGNWFSSWCNVGQSCQKVN